MCDLWRREIRLPTRFLVVENRWEDKPPFWPRYWTRYTRRSRAKRSGLRSEKNQGKRCARRPRSGSSSLRLLKYICSEAVSDFVQSSVETLFFRKLLAGSYGIPHNFVAFFQARQSVVTALAMS